MTLIVEDGTGLANAESYVSVAGFEAYADARGLDYSKAETKTKKEQALRRATQFIESYNALFPGYRTRRRKQALEWPRVGAFYFVSDSGRSDAFYFGQYQEQSFSAQGYDAIASNAIPPEIIFATCEAAVREAQKPNSMQPDLARGGKIHSVTSGPVGVVYAENAPAGVTVSIIETILDALLLNSASSNGLFGEAVRG